MSERHKKAVRKKIQRGGGKKERRRGRRRRRKEESKESEKEDKGSVLPVSLLTGARSKGIIFAANFGSVRGELK